MTRATITAVPKGNLWIVIRNGLRLGAVWMLASGRYVHTLANEYAGGASRRFATVAAAVEHLAGMEGATR